MVRQMERILGYCGLTCSECPVFKATQRDDDEGRAEVLQRQREKWAKIYTKQYGREYKPEDINCDGCPSVSPRIFWYCKECKIRTCAREKNLESCAYCEDYPCEPLSRLFEKSRVPARETLEKLRSDLKIG